jgi:hypothetical protein
VTDNVVFHSQSPLARDVSIPEADHALAEALNAFFSGSDAARPLLGAAHTLRMAGWTPALRVTESLLAALPFAVDGGPDRWAFEAALRDLAASVARGRLAEMACSPQLHAHYQLLRARAADRTAAGTRAPLDELALGGRPVPPATLPVSGPGSVLSMRADYERHLLPALRSSATEPGALDALQDCLAGLVDTTPYDFWRLAHATVQALRRAGRAHDADAKRLYARFNLVLADQGQGAFLAPASLTRQTLAALWRTCVLHRDALTDAAVPAVLRDYGLPLDETGDTGGPDDRDAAAPSEARRVGALAVAPHVFEAMLAQAETTLTLLEAAVRASAAVGPADTDAFGAASDAAYRLGARASQAGLATVALLADALALGWLRHAYIEHGVLANASAATLPLEDGLQALQRMLHQIAGGMFPGRSAQAMAALTVLIETDERTRVASATQG